VVINSSVVDSHEEKFAVVDIQTGVKKEIDIPVYTSIKGVHDSEGPYFFIEKEQTNILASTAIGMFNPDESRFVWRSQDPSLVGNHVLGFSWLSQGLFLFKKPDYKRYVKQFSLIRISESDGRIIWVQEEALQEYDPIDKLPSVLKILDIRAEKICLAFAGGQPPSPPRRLIALDLATGTFIRHWEQSDFTTEQIEEPYWRYPNYHIFYPQHFQWDPKDEKFYLLGGSGLYSLDPRTGETGFSLHNELFEQHQLQPSHSPYLHGDHFYFNSFWEYVPDPVQEPGQRKRWTAVRETGYWSLGAFNIRTHQIDWQYDFPVGYIKNSLYAPKANDRYIVAHDTEKRLHVFEKVSA
jgi:hypothetical protein